MKFPVRNDDASDAAGRGRCGRGAVVLGVGDDGPSDESVPG